MTDIAKPVSVSVRPFQQGDLEGVFSVILPIQQEEYGIAITAQDQPDLNAIDSFYRPGAGEFWVAEHDSQVVGTIALKDIGNSEAALRKMFVAAPYRGSGIGTASKLLSALLAHAGENGIRRIYLGTTDKFLGAHRFYEKNGFTEVERNALPESFPVMAVDSKFYVIALS